MTYSWPGNVRELENYVRKLLIFRDADAIALELQAKMARKALAPVVLPRPAGTPPQAPADTAPVLEQVVKAKQRAETDAILQALTASRWNRKRAALMLKIDYKALLYKMKKLGIEDGSPRNGAAASANGYDPES
jgi:two-component system response regulator AtoC